MIPSLLAAIAMGQAGIGANPVPVGLRLAFYRNLPSQSWSNRADVRPSAGRLPPGLVDYGEVWLEGADGVLRVKGFSGYRKGGWMSALTQPNPGELSYRAWKGEFRRGDQGTPSSILFSRDWWSWKLAPEFPYFPDCRTTHFLGRYEIEAKPDGEKFRFDKTTLTPADRGQVRYEFRTPSWVPAGYPEEIRAGAFPIIALSVRRESHLVLVPDAEGIYASEFEPFLLEPEFPKRLLKAIEEDRTLEYWVVGRTMQYFRVRAYFLGRQRLVFREIDQPALRFDLASFEKDENGSWDPLAGVWIDPETGKLILADDSDGLTRGFVSPTCLFRPEPERTSDFDFVYPKFVRPNRFLPSGHRTMSYVSSVEGFGRGQE